MTANIDMLGRVVVDTATNSASHTPERVMIAIVIITWAFQRSGGDSGHGNGMRLLSLRNSTTDWNVVCRF